MADLDGFAGQFSSATRLTPRAADAHWSPPPGPQHAASLPEFASSSTSDPVFLPPARSAVNPGRPPPLELRPRPHRETQSGVVVRSIAASGDLLWAAHDSGVRVWDLADAFHYPGPDWEPRRGDEGSAPFRESRWTPPALCLSVDPGRGVVWSGHSDGRVRGWSLEMAAARGSSVDRGRVFEQLIEWGAFQAPMLSLAITPYGEVWSGSEGGVIKVWSREAIEKALSLRPEERRKAALLVEGSGVDLRSLVTDGGGACPLPMVDVKLLLSDNCRSKVWSGGYLSFALWDSRTKELLKVISIDGQVDTRFDSLSYQNSNEDYDTKIGFPSYSNKEKSRSPISFFQRSRDALMGAAGAVRRVAVKAAFGDDIRRAEALAISVDGIIWTGSANGSLAQWDGNGLRLQEFQHHSSSVQCICSFGSRLWVGYKDGTVQLMDLDGNLLGGWVSHSSRVVKMAVAGLYVFTLADHGGIRGWILSSPGPLDSILQSALTMKMLSYQRLGHLKMLVGSWNVGQERASYDSLETWLNFGVLEIGLVVVGLQEIEMGAGFLAMAAAKETVGLEGSPNGQWWLDSIGQILHQSSFERVGSRQLAGLLVAVWIRRDLKQYVGDIDTAAVPCGFGRAIGNKGAVGLRMRVHGRTICFVNCHFAAHIEAVGRRNEDFDHVFRTMAFRPPSSGLQIASGGVSSVQLFGGANAISKRKPELSEADMVVFLGDFNYRLYDVSYEEAMELVSQRCFDRLREKDQLRAQMIAGRVFQGLREGQLKFPPTYKFEKYQAGLSGYDCSEKKRIPAWCDRILYRDNRSVPAVDCSLSCPVVSSVSLYDSCMEAIGSDHKPVKCTFNVDIAHVDEPTRRHEFGELVTSNDKVRCLLEELRVVPDLFISTSSIILQNQDIFTMRVANKSTKDAAGFQIMCKDSSIAGDSEQVSRSCERGSFGFPKWLKVTPATGIIYAGQTVEVNVQYEAVYTRDLINGISWNRRSEDNEKVAVLVLTATGACSTEAKSYRIHVCRTSSMTAFSKATQSSGSRMW